jgi:RecJ-like exonuclease
MQKMLEAAKPVVDFINDHDGFAVVSHYDADGLCSGAVLGVALERLGKKYTITPTKQMDSQRIAEIKSKGKHFLFADFGSGQLDTIAANLKSFAVVDHHATLGETTQPHFNAHLFGLDGASEISGAGMSYLVAKAISPDNADLSALAIVGAVGDMQDSTGKLVGFNRKILADAEKAGVIQAKKDIRLFGRHSRPLTQFLSYNADPIFPGITADEAGAVRFLNSAGIPVREGDEYLYYVDLSEDQKKRLVSALVVYGKRNFVPNDYLKSIVGEVYELSLEQDKTFVKDAKDFATLLNACGRHEKGEIGLKVAMGDRDIYYGMAAALLQQHRRMLRDGIEYAKQHGVVDVGHCYLLDGGTAIKDTLIGVIAGMLYGAQVIGQDKPILAFSIDDESNCKFSARATWPLVRKGVHLGKAMKAAASASGGEGGGHNIAAGATVPLARKDEFVRAFDAEVESQLSASSSPGS